MAITKTELKSSFLQEELESEKYQANIKSIQDWLTGQTQAAQQQYQATAQTAAQQASYDISGAYANYLKQQRTVASQGQLESGYKQEVSDVLQSQYGSAYQQARATQAEQTAKAQTQYAKTVAEYGETASKAAQSYYESAIKEAEQKASLYKAAEEYAGISDDSEYAFYTQDETGKFDLSDYGLETMMSKLLDEKGSFKSYLEEQGLTEELEYYLSDPTGLHEELFGITDTVYDPKSQESYKRRLSAVSSKTGQSIIDTIQRPVLDVNWNDFADWDWGTSGHDKLLNMTDDVIKYATEDLGLTDDEIRKMFNISVDRSIEDIIRSDLAMIGHKISSIDDERERFPQQEFNAYLDKFVNYAKQKYLKKE